MSPVILLLILVVSAIAGYKLIGNVPSLLHTPLMSGMNALSGIVVIGAIVAASMDIGVFARLFVYAALFLAMINVAGGFGVTDRMLKMFKGGKKR